MNRNELREKLRKKINDKRNGTGNAEIAKMLKQDPVTTFLNLGIDNPDILSQAHNIVKQATNFNPKKKEKKDEKEEDEDEEEPPPI